MSSTATPLGHAAQRRALGDPLGDPLGRRSMIAVVCLLAVGLRSIGLFERSLWFDEAMSWRTAALPWPEMFSSVKRNTHPPLYFAILKGWCALWGATLPSLRSLNLVIAAASVPAIDWFLVAGKIPWRSRLLAMLLFACHPFQVALAADVRMYPLLVLWMLLSSGCMLRALAQPSRQGWWWAFGLSSLAMLYTHYVGLFLVAAQWVYLLGWLWRSQRLAGKRRFASGLKGMLLAALILALGWAAWLPYFLKQRVAVARDWWNPSLDLQDLASLAAQWTLGLPGGSETTGRSWIGFAGLVLLVGWLWCGPRANGASVVMRRVLSLLIGLPAGLAILVSLGSTNLVIPRYFAAGQALSLLGLALWVRERRSWFVRQGTSVAIILTLIGLNLEYRWREDITARPGVVGAMALIDSSATVSDPVYCDTPMIYLPALYHSRQRGRMRLYEDSGVASFFTGGPVLRRSEIVFSLPAVPRNCGGVWWVSSEVPPPSVWPPSWRLEQRWFFPGTVPFQETVVVTRLTRRAEEEEITPHGERQ